MKPRLVIQQTITQAVLFSGGGDNEVPGEDDSEDGWMVGKLLETMRRRRRHKSGEQQIVLDEILEEIDLSRFHFNSLIEKERK